MEKSFENYPRDECGVMGIYNNPSAAYLVSLGLHALQHRGQESTGITSSDYIDLHRITGMGIAANVYTPEKLSKLPGFISIGHNRYSTTGGNFLTNAQPLRANSSIGPIALAHNGNLINSLKLRRKMEKDGAIFQTSVDSEVIIHAMARAGETDFLNSLFSALKMIQGAYSLLVMNKSEIYAIRDPFGFRPLCFGIIDKKESSLKPSYVLASETCAMDLISAKFIRDIHPGEVLKIHSAGYKSYFPWAGKRYTSLCKTGIFAINKFNRNKIKRYKKKKTALCIFEFIYFSRPDSKIFGQSVYSVRKRLGYALARDHPVDADVVISVPDSSTIAAIGYAELLKLPYETGLIRNHYMGRTFIEPDEKIRNFGAKIKYSAVEEVLRDKRIVVIDDSIMRGTTCREIIKLLHQAKPIEIHLRISAPPTRFPCYYGIDIPTKTELIASMNSLEDIKKYLDVDSIEYLSIDAIVDAAGMNRNNWCLACFDGKYPLVFKDIQENSQKSRFDKFISEEY
jgi:amidophosphoribosyltransferase